MAKAKLKIPLPLPLKLGAHHAYQIEGTNGIFIRQNGGISKERFKTDPALDEVRANASEFGGGSTMASGIRRALSVHDHLKDYNYFNDLGKICRKIGSFDQSNVIGERSIRLTEYKSMLSGFDLNKKQIFPSVVKALPSCRISRIDMNATINFTDLYPGITLINPWNLEVYRFILCMAVVKDQRFTKYGYEDQNGSIKFSNTSVTTEWISFEENFPATEFNLGFRKEQVIDDSCTLILCIGIEFGKLASFTKVTPQKNAGCARIIAVG